MTDATRGYAVTPAWISAARVGIGVLFLIRTTRLAALLPVPFAPPDHFLLGWPDPRVFRFAPLVSVPYWFVAAACVARTLGGILFTAGLWTRLSGSVAGLCGYLVVAQDPLGFSMTIHTMFLAVILLAWTDGGSRFALRPVPAESPASSYGLMRIWVASIYVWAGLAKLHHDWLSGGVLRMLAAQGLVRGPVVTWILATPGRAAAIAPAIAVAEVALGCALLYRRTRMAALVAGYSMHVLFETALSPDLFGWTMACLLLVFIGDIGPWRDVFRAKVSPVVGIRIERA